MNRYLKHILMAICLILLSSCGPSEAAIQRAIQQTQVVIDQTQTAQAEVINQAIATEQTKATATSVSLTAEAFVIAYCGKDQVDAKIKELNDFAVLFSDDMELAQNTGRIALSPVIAKMQEKAQQVERLEVPACLKKARDYMAASMNSSIDGFLAFMAQKDESIVSSHFIDASRLLDKYTAERERIIACAPDCNL